MEEAPADRAGLVVRVPQAKRTPTTVPLPAVGLMVVILVSVPNMAAASIHAAAQCKAPIRPCIRNFHAERLPLRDRKNQAIDRPVYQATLI